MKLGLRRDRRRSKRRNKSEASAAIQKRLEKLWKICVGEFVAVATQSMAIDTGMSVASFAPLAARVRLASTLKSAVSSASKGAKFGSKGYKSTAFPGITNTKSMAHGEKLGREAYTLTFGTPSNPRFTFEFHIVVLQHYLHDQAGSGAVNSQNWQSLEKGRKAFLRLWNDLLPLFVTAEDINTWLLTGDYKDV